MPPWVSLAPRCASSCRKIAIEPSIRAIRSCNLSKPRFPSSLRVRSASTHLSPTAINYRPNVPARNKELHEALQKLGEDAEQFYNLSRLQLALRGLEGEGDEAVTRVAVLGLNSQVGAQRLARLLLADPLGKEEEWEKELDGSSDGNTSAVLIRFGEQDDVHPPNPLYKTISVPSRVLGKHNIEVLVSTLNTDVASNDIPTAERPEEAILVPKLQAPSGSGVPVPWPVHKTLIVGEGLDSAIAFGRFTASSAEDRRDLVKVAVDLPPPSKEVEPSENALSTPVNVGIGTEALDSIRASVQNSLEYERKWFASNLPHLSNWLVRNVETTPSSTVKPAHGLLIASLLDETEANVARAEAQHIASLASPTNKTQEQVNAEMLGYLETWAEKGHEELRDSLDEGFHSKSWKRLAWWKLWWRVDDVGMVLEEMLQRRWLVKTEKDAIYLAGRMSQAGFPEDISSQAPLLVQDTIPASEDQTSPPPPSLNSTTPPTPETQTETQTQTPPPPPPPQPEPTNLSTHLHPRIPFPTQITTTRTTLLATTLPPLQSLAQRLLLTTLSTTGTSTALSALLYLSSSSFTLVEAAAVAGLGLTLSLRRMQRVWEGAREEWQARVREEGRLVLKGVESDVRGIVVQGKKGLKDGGGGGEDEVEEGVREREVARGAVQRVREVLKGLL
ncbi:hypothetical protein DM02DRAFT_563051 [Periconia macrospinosa]|uniref:Mmc1 C-terminal domain-containing protein n=1 Tax=Periconia macrospinosa TaxID=97972 RepID=A0A2V1DT56_9PLEO|nr:hypothetical protein DM02DRAFT_563051 [Periconia macrospinosa]